MPDTVIDMLREAASQTERGFTFLDDDLAPRDYPFSAVAAEAERRGRLLRRAGLEPGDRIALVVPDGRDFVLTFLGAVRAGIVPVPMYPPLALGKMDGYLDTARRIMTAAGVKQLLTSKSMSALLWGLVPKVPSLEDLITTDRLAEGQDAPEVDLDARPIRADDLCFLQFTSGSTADPKGVMVTHGNLIANARAIMTEGLGAYGDRGDRAVSWLPLYHDMGLIGFVISPLFTTVPVVFIPTLSFVKRPGVWMETMSKYQGTISFAPNFAFGLAAKRARGVDKIDLSRVRVLGCGAEPIHAGTLRRFADAFAPAGLRGDALMPCYGMAEATLAMAFDRVDQPFGTVVIDRDRYEADGQAVPARDGLELVGCGRTFSGHQLGVMGPGEQLLPDGEVGEIVFRGPSVTPGYFGNEAATQAALQNGWLHTGDLGFMREGQIFVSGRMKDLIILNGRNYHPQAIEWEVEQLEGVRRGNVVAFSTSGEHSEQLAVAVETKVTDPDARAALEEAVRVRVRQNLGVEVKHVALIGAGALPKTSSGKLQRSRTRRAFEEGSLGQGGNRTLGSTATRLLIARHVTASAIARLGHEVGRPARTARRLMSAVRKTEPRG